MMLMGCALFFLLILIRIIFQQELQHGKNVARLAERRRSLIFPHTDHCLPALPQPARQLRKITVTGYQAEAFQLARIKHVHSVDDHRRIRGIFPRSVAELLDRCNRILQKLFLPARVVRLRPVPVDPLICHITVLGQLIQYGLDIFCRHIVRIDQQRESVFHVM